MVDFIWRAAAASRRCPAGGAVQYSIMIGYRASFLTLLMLTVLVFVIPIIPQQARDPIRGPEILQNFSDAGT